MATDKNFVIKNGLTVGTSEVITSAGNLTNVGAISSGAINTTEKLTITNANFNNHIEFVRSSSTMGLSPSGNELLVVGGGLAPSDSASRSLGRSDKIWDDVFANTYRIGTTIVIDSSRNLTNIGTISSGAITSSGNGEFTGTYLYASGDIRVGTSTGATNQTGIIKNGGTTYGLGLFNWGDANPTFIGGSEVNFRTEPGSAIALKSNGTTFLDASRNLTNIGTISSGAITSSGTLSLGSYFQAGTSVSAGFYQDAANGAYRAIGTSSTRGFYFQSNGGANTYMYVGLTGTYAGRVGVGTASPAEQFHATGVARVGSLKIDGTEVITTNRELHNLEGGIRSNDVFSFLTQATAAQAGKFLSVAAQTSYANGASSGMFNALNGYAVGTGNGTTVIDSSRNLTNIGTISSGAITANAGTGVNLFYSSQTSSADDWQTSPISIRERGLNANNSTSSTYAPNLNFHWASVVSRSLTMLSDGNFVLGEWTASGAPATTASLSTLNTGAYQINGTTVIDSSRNLTNIGTISSGAITATNISVGNAVGNTRSEIDTNALYTSYYNTETSPRIQLGRDVGIAGGAGLALGGNNSYALIGTNNTSGSAMYFKAAAAVGSVTTNPDMTLNSSGNLVVRGTISSGAITSSGTITGTAFYGNGSNLTNIGTASQANNLNAIDDRDIAPEDLGYADDFRIYFAEKGGLETGTIGANYQDVLVLNSYSDSSGGDANALAFDKSEKKIYHYQADQTATNWGTAKTLAYIDDNITGTAAGLSGTPNITVGTISSGAITANGILDVTTLRVRGDNDTSYSGAGLTGGISLYSTGATTSQIMFKPTSAGSLGNHGFCTDSYNTYFVMDTTNRGWVFRNHTTATNVASISNTGGASFNNGIKINATTIVDSSRNLTNIGTISSGAITSSSYGVFGATSVDPDSFTAYAGGFGTIADGSGWGARGVFVHGGGAGDAAAIAHNGNNLYFGIQNGSSANSMSTWMQVSPAKAVDMTGAASVALPTTTSGAITSTGNSIFTGSGSSGNAFLIRRGSDNAGAFRVQNDGVVITEANYLYAASSGISLYVQNSLVARGSILNDTSGQPVKVADDFNVTGVYQANGTTVIDSSRNVISNGLTIGNWTIGSNNSQGRIGKASDRPTGAITNQIGTSSGYWEIVDYAWSLVAAQCNNSGDFTAYRDFNTATGGYKINGTQVIDSSRNINCVNFQNTGGAKIEVQDSSDGGSSRGIYMWNSADANWVIYMSTAGAGKSSAGGTACSGLDGRTSHGIRYRVANSSTQIGHIFENASDQALFQIQPDTGNIFARGNVTAYASDARLKTNIKTIENPIEKIKRIRGVEFDWLDNIEETHQFKPKCKRETGVIAQEIEAVIPDAISPAPFNNEYKTVEKDKIVALLIEGIKEQQKQIDELKQEVSSLRSKI